MKQKRTRKQNIAILFMTLFFCVLLSSCKEAETADIPELIAPRTASETYRPAAMRSVDPVKLLCGEVVPVDHPVFSNKAVNISEIRVGIGDSVEEGEVVAVAGIKNEEIEGLNEEIASLNRRRDLLQSVSQKKQEELFYEELTEIQAAFDWGARRKEQEITLEQENLRYDLAVIDSEIKAKQKRLSELKEREGEQIFTAPHSGIVTYVMDTNVTNRAESCESILVISDLNEAYIEVPGLPINRYEYAGYESKWILLNGKKVLIREKEYTEEEAAYAQSLNRNPYIAFTAEGADLPLGSNVVLYFKEGKDRQTLAVGNDSVIRENGEAFVYVKREGKADEKRSVVTGATDGLYTEIRSGLEEGEAVLYRNEAILPTRYDVVTAALSDYSVKCSSKITEWGYPVTDIYLAECDGSYRKISETGEVTEGSELFGFRSVKGTADVEAARLSITNLDQNREKAHKEYQKSRDQLTLDIEKAAEEAPFIRQIMNCEIAILDLNEEYQQKEYAAKRAVLEKEYKTVQIGTGETGSSMTASEDGKLGNTPQDHTEFSKGDFIMAFRRKGGQNNILFSALSNGGFIDGSYVPTTYPAKIGANVALEGADREWKGLCIGRNGDNSRYLLFTRDEKPCIVISKPYVRNAPIQLYMKLEADISDEERKTAVLSYDGIHVSQVTVLPASAVKSETDEISKVKRNFVWKLENDEIVKEYVTVFDTDAVTPEIYITSGVEPGDKVLDDHLHSDENNS